MIIYLLYKHWGVGAGEGLLVHSWKSLGRTFTRNMWSLWDLIDEKNTLIKRGVLLPFIENTKKEGIPLRSMFWRSIKRWPPMGDNSVDLRFCSQGVNDTSYIKKFSLSLYIYFKIYHLRLVVWWNPQVLEMGRKMLFTDNIMAKPTAY